MKFLYLFLLLVAGLILTILIQFTFSLQVTYCPILTVTILWFLVGFISNKTNKYKLNVWLVFLCVSFFLILIQLYGLHINYKGLMFLSPSIVVLACITFFSGYNFNRFSLIIKLIVILVSTIFSISLGFYIIPMQNFAQSINEKGDNVNNSYKLIEINGSNLSLNKKIVVINFWNSNCSYCFKKLPYIISLKRSLKTVDVLFVEVNTGRIDTFNEFKKSALQHHFPEDVHPVYDSSSLLSNQVHVDGVPHQIILKEGKVVSSIVGFSEEEANFFVEYSTEKIKELLR